MLFLYKSFKKWSRAEEKENFVKNIVKYYSYQL